MANQKKVTTSYDSGDKLTAKGVAPTNYNETAPPDGGTSNNESLLRVVMDDFKAARDYVKNNFQSDWEDYWKCYHGIRTKRGYEGVSDDFVPETFTIVESVKANIAGGKPKFTFVPMREEQQQDTQILNHLMDFYWDQNRMVQKSQNWIQDMLIYGNGVIMVSWEGNMPRIQNIPLADFFVDPASTHMNNPEEPGYPKYAGYRYLTDREELAKKEIINPETGEMEPLYKNLDDVPDYSGDWDKMDKEAKEAFLGSTLGKDSVKRQVECIVYYTKKKKIVIANRKTIIYSGENPYYRKKSTQKVVVNVEGQEKEVEREIPEIKPFLPFAILRNYVDSNLFYAKGDVAIIIDRQETLNDVSNQKQDNITYVLDNMWQVDPLYAHLVEQIQSAPGVVLPIPDGALRAIEKQVVTQEADLEMARIKDEMRRATAADEVIQGVTQDKGRITATEVNATLNQASQRFTTKLNTLEAEGYAQLGRIMFKMVQIFVTQDMAVRVIGPEGTMWKDFDPNDYTGEYEPKVSLESNQKAARAEEGQKFMQVHTAYLNSPLVNQKEMARMYLEKVMDLSDERIKALLDVPPPPEEPPLPPPSVSLRVDLQPDQQAQLLEKYGITSTPADLILHAGDKPAALVNSPDTLSPENIPPTPSGMGAMNG
jgi:hypothetical protein